MIIDYDSQYDEQVKDLLVELQQHLVEIDQEGYHTLEKEYREKYFTKTMEEINKKQGKIFLYQDADNILGMVIGIINNEKEHSYDFNAPRRGRITELIVRREYRGKHVGKELLEHMKEYLKKQGCEKILIAVFGYNQEAIRFYEKNGFHTRMIDMIEN